MVNLNEGSYFNKQFFMLWLRPKKAIRLSSQEEYKLYQSPLFKSGVSIFLIAGFSYFVVTVAYDKVISWQLPIRRLALIAIALFIPFLLMLLLKKSSLKDSEIITNILGHSISWDCYVYIDFEKRRDKIKYIMRILLSFIIILIIIGVGLIIFLYNGMMIALIVYIAALYFLLGTSYIFPSKGIIKEIKSIK